MSALFDIDIDRPTLQGAIRFKSSKKLKINTTRFRAASTSVAAMTDPAMRTGLDPHRTAGQAPTRIRADAHSAARPTTGAACRL